ncbi:MAG: 2-oxoacid:acceptor oxidoreductase subunit alpha, partial [Deltaproteobacteria bacterium]|nr:2-oxoacid:acceptor oxidoreductase subunit alpha [Deltaproteobacteria bacterium]
MKMEVKILQGNEAVVDAAIAAGCRFFAGYPITPASEIAEQMALK